MKKGDKVNINLSTADAKKLGITGAVEGTGVYEGPYTNGIEGHYVKFNNRTVAIADRYNAVTPV